MKLRKAAFLAVVAGAQGVPALCRQKPNIIFFLIDDYGWVDSSVPYGEEVYPMNRNFITPNMERLAEKGVIFTNAYACPVSTPTRTSMMSGMNAAHTGITNWTATLRDEPSDAVDGGFDLRKYTDEGKDGLLRPDWNVNGLSPEEGIAHAQYATPFVRHLRDNGYYTVHIGKAHWATAGTPGASPYNMGFLVNVSGSINGMPRSYYGSENFGNRPEQWNYMAPQNLAEYYGQDIYLTEALTLEALKALEYPISKGQPFYLYMSHYATHLPVMKDPRFVDQYIEMGQDKGQAGYASMVAGVDKSLGDLMDFLEEKGIADNTVIVFMADNGGNANTRDKGGEPHMQNAPLREGKGSCYLGGIRVPMMVYIPGKTAPGTRINTPVLPEDIYPTMMELAGIRNYDHVQPIDGKSIVSLAVKGSRLAAKAAWKGEISSQKEANAFVVPESVSGIDPNREVIMHYPHQWKPKYKEEIDFLSTIIVGDWKLVYVMMNTVPGWSVADGKVFELYNIREDISEKHNLADEYPEKVKELAVALGKRFREWNTPMPRYKSTGKTVPYPDEIAER